MLVANPVDLSKNCTNPLLEMLATEVDVSSKLKEPLFKNSTFVPREALFEKTIVPELPEASTAVTKFCVRPELFAMPVPLRVRVRLGLALMV